MTTTKRRTARIAAPTTGYVAIKCDYINPDTNEIHCTAKHAMRIAGQNGAFVDIKGAQEFYLVRALSLGANMFYIVLMESSNVDVELCTCPATKPMCRHAIAIEAKVADRRKAMQAEKAKRPATQEEIDTFCWVVDEEEWGDLVPSWKKPAIVEEPKAPAPKPTPAPSKVVTGPDWRLDLRGAQRRPATTSQPLSTRGSLNGARAFSLMR